jgi:hypothetical protein
LKEIPEDYWERQKRFKKLAEKAREAKKEKR